MRYTYDEIKGKNYLKVGTFEECFECENGEELEGREKNKKKIEPWLSAALQSDHLSLLIGAGFTTAICQIAGVPSSSMGKADFGNYSDKINSYAMKSAEKLGRGSDNIEDQIRTAFSLLQGYEINEDINQYSELAECIDSVLQGFAESILSSETNLCGKMEDENGKRALTLLQTFLLTFASRTATRERTHIFTTNYDRMIEYGCDLAGMKNIR